ncbi:hypothetical protein SanaruYs_34580 [Chryseotalea sanaruensis]|uniref:Uncharacterized protein n=1 Tax=Chryseotalea sanaruensis TaxID=2482724 RepID=A0A401UE78_9BACT|nr:hypothetical protein [Chryseotalea sanaruensis]GCC53215.1 hypothetical protein SanaruYs_34580 [Chryseotalea sanaruensis]
MDFLGKIKDKSPEYDSSHEELISKFTVLQGGRTGTSNEASIWQQGKYFFTKYEIFMYAVLLGLRDNYSLPLNTNSKKNTFMVMKNWHPADVTDYIIMGVLTKAKIDFNKLEQQEDKEIEKEITKIRKLMEEFANGGFDIIRSKLEKEPSFFENNDNCFIDLLESKLN